MAVPLTSGLVPFVRDCTTGALRLSALRLSALLPFNFHMESRSFRSRASGDDTKDNRGSLLTRKQTLYRYPNSNGSHNNIVAYGKVSGRFQAAAWNFA